jgi:ABC-type branched-subunit amino acid transport system ATPase component
MSALEARDVSVNFGGLHALKGVDVTVEHDEIVGLIGGNGAGKTTFMDCVSGYVQPEPGASITAFGEELVGLPPEMRPYLKVGRSYQSARLYPGLTVTETLLVAVEHHAPTGVLAAMLGLSSAHRAEKEKAELVAELIESTGLQSYAEKLVGELSTGTRRVVDLASILAQRPKLLLLDEPTAGLAQRETEAFGPLIKRVQQQLGCAVLIIEHDIVLMGSLCDRLYALESGAVLASGPTADVLHDPRVIASYLGTDEAAIRRSGALAPSARRTRRREPLRAASR